MEPPKKRVRFTGVQADVGQGAHHEQCPHGTAHEGSSSPKDIEKLMERVHQRAERRKRSSMRSPPPPSAEEEESSSSGKQPAPKDSSSSDNNNNDLDSMQRKLVRMEHKIKESAQWELRLMNKCKKLRDKRAGLTRMYESMAQQLREMQKTQQPGTKIFQMGRLPPLMTTTRRVPSNNINNNNSADTRVSL